MPTADVHETSRARKLTPFERRGDTLIGGTREHEEDENSGNPDERASYRPEGH